MTASIASSSYGKACVHLVKVERGPERDQFKDVTVEVRLAGAFEAVYRDGDNSGLLSTDAMTNAVYALGRRRSLDPPEGFAEALARDLMEACPSARRAHVSLAVRTWEPLAAGGVSYPRAFARAGAELRTACATVEEGRVVVEAGLEGAPLVRTAGSSFRGFLRGRYGTLQETDDRLLATDVFARWRYGRTPLDPCVSFGAVRTALLQTFASHPSESLQHTLYAMGEAAFAACADVEAIRLALPNLHHLLVDLAPFGLDNPNQVFVPSREPRGVVEAELTRS
ncbi:MAG TPA: urate oxidase [Myxococcota bacterium]|nr:urate oxidase [Myxococcota bacterium]